MFQYVFLETELKNLIWPETNTEKPNLPAQHRRRDIGPDPYPILVQTITLIGLLAKLGLLYLYFFNCKKKVYP